MTRAPEPGSASASPQRHRITVLADGILFGESPRWRDGRLWFSDFYAHAVKSVSMAGDVRTEMDILDQPSGSGWMPDGSLLVVSMTERRLLRRHLEGDVTVHADLGDMASFHCNDMIVDRNGRAYVGEYGFDLDGALEERGPGSVFADHPTASLTLVESDGTTRYAASDLHFPNGGAITPDGCTLIISEMLAGRLTAFDIAADGILSGRRTWASLFPRVADGIALDASGAVWIANPLGSECVRVVEGGEVLDVIGTDDPCFACALGGPEGRTLFMLTARSAERHEASKRKSGRIIFAEVDVPASEPRS